MQLVPNQIKTALTVLASKRSSPKIISMLLPTTLREIERLGKSCVTWANATHVNFVTVMSLIGEVISTTEVSRGVQETRLRQTEIELNVSHVMKDQLKQLDQTIRQHYDEARESVRKAQEEYSRALRKIPTGFQSLLLDLGRAVIGIVKSTGQAFSARIGGTGGGAGGGSSDQQGTSLASGQSLAYAKLFSDSLNKGVPKIKRILNFDNSTFAEMENPSKELEAYKVIFETFSASISGGKPSNFRDQAGQVIQSGIKLINDIARHTTRFLNKGENITQEVADGLKNRLDELVEDVKPLVAAEQLSGAAVPPAGGASSGMGDSSQNEKFAAQLSLNRLQSAESRYDKIFDSLKQNQQELAKLMGKIASLDMTRIHYKEILELLREALHLLAKVREQWGKLVLFFAEVATCAEITLSGTLGPFITQATQAGTESLTTDERLFYVDLLKAQAGEIDSQTQKLFLMSRTYVDMSTRYIMNRLAGLSKMLTARDDTERTQYLNELNRESQATQEAVMELIVQRKNTYQVAIQKRRVELEKFVAKLGGTDADDLAAIEAGKALLAKAS